MSAASGTTTFSCSGCGKKYVWKPELAGKTVKCKCGQGIPVPAAAASPAAAPARKPPAISKPALAAAAPARSEADDLYDLAADDAAPSPVRPAAASAAPAIVAPVAIPGMEDDAYRCPSCNEPMQPGAIICASCGFNLKTGARETIARGPGTAAGKSAAKAATKAAASSGFAGLPSPRKKPQMVEDKKGEMMKIIIPVILIIAVIGAFAMFKFVSSRMGNSAASMNTGKGDDPSVADKMENESPKEVHEWFKQNPSRMMGELSEHQAIYKADELEKMGAKKCYAFGSMMCLCMAVELPDDPAQRKAIIDYRNKWNLERHYPAVKDEGQKYVMLNFTP
jgi:hypothetical protein